DGRQAPLLARPAPRVGAGARGRQARSHTRGAEGGIEAPWRQCQLVRGLEFPPTRRRQLQKKAYAQANRIAPTWRGGARNGSNSRARLIRTGWFSLMRPGPGLT